MESSLKMQEEASCCRWRPVPWRGWGLSPPLGQSWTAAAGWGGRKVVGDFDVKGSPPKVSLGLCCSLLCGSVWQVGGTAVAWWTEEASITCSPHGEAEPWPPIRPLVVQEPSYRVCAGAPAARERPPRGWRDFPVWKDGGHRGGRPASWP